ncbi:hypothetical protein YB2330_000244 [Saitoella coloradoensis]
MMDGAVDRSGNFKELGRMRIQTAEAKLDKIEGLIVELLAKRAENKAVALSHRSRKRRLSNGHHGNNVDAYCGSRKTAKSDDDEYIIQVLENNMTGLPFELPPDQWLPDYVMNSIPHMANTALSTHRPKPPRNEKMNRSNYQELLEKYMEFAGPRMQHSGPLYFDLWLQYAPSMALQTGAKDCEALLEAMLATADMFYTLSINPDKAAAAKATSYHYDRAIGLQAEMSHEPETTYSDAAIACATLLAYYELWVGEHVKMAMQLLKIIHAIHARHAQGTFTAATRSLFVWYVHMDVQCSLVTGNPAWLDEHLVETLHPLAFQPYPEDQPIVYVAELAFVRLDTIVGKFTAAKDWAVGRRKKRAGDTDPRRRLQLETLIKEKAAALEAELDEFRLSLPSWFDGYPDIGSPGHGGLVPRSYPDQNIAVVLGNCFATYIGIHRLVEQDIFIQTPKITAYAEEVLRAYAFCDDEIDSAMLPASCIAGLELGDESKRKWLLEFLGAKYARTGYHIVAYMMQILQWGWAKMDGEAAGRFSYIPDGVVTKVEGYSENTYEGQGVLSSLLEDMHITDRGSNPLPNAADLEQQTYNSSSIFDQARVWLEAQNVI